MSVSKSEPHVHSTLSTERPAVPESVILNGAKRSEESLCSVRVRVCQTCNLCSALPEFVRIKKLRKSQFRKKCHSSHRRLNLPTNTKRLHTPAWRCSSPWPSCCT